MCAQRVGKRVGAGKRFGILAARENQDAVKASGWFFLRQFAVMFILIGELSRFDLAGFDIRLIERIDADDGACDSDSDFAQEEKLAELIDIVECEPDDGLSG